MARAFAPRHLSALDGIRGVAALLMVFRHTDAFFGPVGFSQSYLAVDVFFVLSGMVLCSAYEHRLCDGLSPFRFMVLRFIRIYPLYALGTIIGLFAALAAGQTPSLRSIVLAAMLLPNINLSHAPLFPLDGPAWTLCLEMAASLTYCVWGWRLSNLHLLKGIAVSCFGLVACLVAMPEHSLDLGWSVHTIPGGIFRLSFGFTAGILLCRIFYALSDGEREDRAPRYQRTLSWLMLGLAAAILVAEPSASLRWAFDLAVVVLAFPALVFASAHLRPCGWSRRVFQLMGAISFPLYAVHEPFGRLVQVFVWRCAGVRVEAHAPVAGFILLAALLLLSFALDHMFDSPLRRWLMKRTDGAPQSLLRPEAVGIRREAR